VHPAGGRNQIRRRVDCPRRPEVRCVHRLWDSPFPGGPGKTWSAEDFVSLVDDLEARVFDQLPDETWFYPGHGDDSTLGAQRPHLGEWRARGW